VQRASGLPVTVFNRVTTGQQAMGMRLLNQAADAGLTASYQGTEQISESGMDGSVQMTSRVWHQGGGGTLVQTASGTSSPAASSTVASGSPDGVFGVTRTLVTLLSQHYVAVYWGSGTVAGRPAAVVELYRFDGSLAARYWLDRQTMLPLRREIFGTSDNVISEDAFVQVQFGALAGAAAASASDTPAPSSSSAWVTASAPAQFRATLAGQGWPVPAALAGRLPLYAAGWSQTASGRVMDLEYSDGLYVVSLFVQRGNLAASLLAAGASGRAVGLCGRALGDLGAGRLRLHDDRGRARAAGYPGGGDAAGRWPGRIVRPAAARTGPAGADRQSIWLNATATQQPAGAEYRLK